MKTPRPRPTLTTPKPDPRIVPTEDEFTAWCEHPVTRWVAAGYDTMAARTVALWGGKLISGTPEQLPFDRVELATRRDGYLAFLQTNHADYLMVNNPEEWTKTYGEARD